MKFVILIAVVFLAIVDVASGRAAAMQQQVAKSSFINSFKSVCNRAPNQIRNIIQNKASIINTQASVA